MTWYRAVGVFLPGKDTVFGNADMSRHENIFSALFPANRHVRDKIRQVLQILAADGRLSHVTIGTWKVK